MSGGSPWSDRTAAVMVTYRPSEEAPACAEAVAAQFPCVVIVDNGSGPRHEVVLQKLEALPGIELLRLDANRGIAAALNIGIRRLQTRQVRWVALFDQDTWIPRDYLNDMLRTWELCPWSSRLALLSPVHESENKEDSKVPLSSSSAVCEPVASAISSGALVLAEAMTAVGGFDESLFIDYVDFDFCLRLRRAGYRLGRAPCVRVRHNLGRARPVRLGPWNLTIRSHQPWRYYYIFRNRILLYRRYWCSAPGWCLHDLFWFVLDGIKAGCLESERRECVSWALRGIRDGLLGRRGARVLPSAPDNAPEPRLESR